MIRFIMPECTLSISERINDLNNQFNSFMHSSVLDNYLNILDIDNTDIEDIYNQLETYNTRKGKDGQIRESQLAPLNELLEDNRDKLFPLYEDFGLVSINKTRLDNYTHIALLGGSANSNFDKTIAACRFITDDVEDISALSCYRPLPPTETKNLTRERKGDYETEFGSFDTAFKRLFQIAEKEDEVRQYDFPRNMNYAQRIKTYTDNSGRQYRIFASPSSKSDERAGTYDTCVHYTNNLPYDKQVNVLIITNNQYCNYQFIPFVVALFRSNHKNVNFDIVGCSDDEHLITANKYNSNQFYGDIRSIIEWIIRFKKEFVLQY